MRGIAAPKVYRSFEEFERDELRKLDGLHVSIDDMLDEMFADELDFERPTAPKSNRGRSTTTRSARTRFDLAHNKRHVSASARRQADHADCLFCDAVAYVVRNALTLHSPTPYVRKTRRLPSVAAKETDPMTKMKGGPADSRRSRRGSGAALDPAAPELGAVPRLDHPDRRRPAQERAPRRGGDLEGAAGHRHPHAARRAHRGSDRRRHVLGRLRRAHPQGHQARQGQLLASSCRASRASASPSISSRSRSSSRACRRSRIRPRPTSSSRRW